MKQNMLCKNIEKSFSFLEVSFSCHIVSSKITPLLIEIIYKNMTTGITVTYESPEGCLWIMLHRLIHREIMDDSREQINNIELNDLLAIVAPQKIIRSIYFHQDNSRYFHDKKGLMNYIDDIAYNLKEYSSKILNGDFSIYSSIDKKTISPAPIKLLQQEQKLLTMLKKANNSFTKISILINLAELFRNSDKNKADSFFIQAQEEQKKSNSQMGKKIIQDFSK